MAHLLLAVLAFGFPQGDKVDLNRGFRAGDKASFQFTSRVYRDIREEPLETFIPENDGYEYTFTTAVESMKPDGVADVRFKRPKMILNIGETFESPPKQEVLAKDESILYTISRRNQVLSLKDETPKKKEKKPSEPPPFMALPAPFRAQLDIGAWIGQLRRMAGFANFFDLGPILPNRPVAVGDSWKETVGYAPTTLSAGADKGKTINARIDYLLTFRGKGQANGNPAWLIEGKINEDTDAAPFVAESMGIKLDRAPFKEIRLKMAGTVNYYLDVRTLEVLKVEATSQGEVNISVPEEPGGPVYEEKFRSRALLVRK